MQRDEKARAHQIERFVDGAPVVTNLPHKNEDQPDPHGPPTHEMKLRLNDYQYDLLKRIAKQGFGSMHAAALRILVPAMERKLDPAKPRTGAK